MRRIDTATKAVDLFGAGKHGFKNGDPNLAILATKLNAEFFNSVQEELSGAIEGAGLTLAPADNTQLLAAITALARGVLPKRSFAANDYIRIPDVPGGLIIQWGNTIAFSGSPYAAAAVPFPIAFPSAVLTRGASSLGAAVSCATSSSLTTITITNSTAATSQAFWFAIGY